MPTSHNSTLEPITRLDDEELEVTVYDINDAIKNITSDTLVFEARLRAGDDTPLIRKDSTVSSQIQKTDAPNGKATIFIDDVDTEPLTKTTTLKCTLVATNPQGKDASILFNLPVTYRK